MGEEMNSEAVLYLAPLIAGTIVSLLLVWMIYPRRSSPIIRTFIFLLLGACLWSFAYAMELWSDSYSTSFFWRRFKYFGIVLIPIQWVVFSFHYAGKEKWANRRTFVLLSIIPVFMLIMLWTNDYHSLYYAESSSAEWGPFSGIDDVEGPLYWIFTYYTYILLMVGNILILRGALTTARIYTKQSLAAVCGIMIPLIGNMLYIVGRNPFPFRYDITPSLFVVSGLVFWWSIIRFRFLDIIPIAREILVENFSDAIFVLDSKNRIIDVNPAAKKIIVKQITPHSTTNVIGERAADVFRHLPELLAKCQDEKEMRSKIELTQDKETRYYDIEVSPVYRQKQLFLGRVITLKDITESKMAERALKKSKETSERYLEVAAELIIALDTKGNITLLNESGQRLLGYRIGELIGRNWFDTCLPEHVRKEVREVFNKLMLGEMENIEIFENPVLLKNGEERVIHWHNTLLRDEESRITGTLSSGEDITEQKEVERELEIQKVYMKELFESAPEAIAILDNEDRVQKINRDFTNLFGYSSSEAIGRKINDLIVPADLKAEGLKATADVAAGERISIETIRLNKDSQRINVSILGHPIKIEGKQLAVYGIYRDITEQKRTMEKRDELEKMKSDFILLTSHEMGTPVMAIDYRIDSLVEGLEPLDPEKRADVESIKYNLERLENLKKSLSNLAILELGRFKPQKEAIFIQTITRHVVEEYNFIAQEKDIRISIDLQNLPMITADKVRIHEVVSILVENAIRYTPNGGRVEITGKEDEDHIQVMVKDNGIGIAQEEHENIFKEFYQVKDIMGYKEGFGLGLSIARGIIQSHNGVIWVESEFRKGSSFYFRIPKE